MAYTLIVTEKPSSALKIATALSDKKPVKNSVNSVSYYQLKHNDREIIVACAVGHLFVVAEKEKKGWTYPVFDVTWKKVADVNKKSTFTRKYLNTIKSLSKDAENFVIATDLDIEGETIGYNIIRFICNKKDASRMKFSTLTKSELLKSYENAQNHIEWGLAHAGETRHIMDFFFGINLSRALTLSIKNSTGRFKLLSSGRVQGPALKILAEREKEIKAFKPVPFWQIELNALFNKKPIQAFHINNKFWDKKKADEIYKNSKGKKAFIKNITRKQFDNLPPNPFDLTSLQLEAYKTFGFSPQDTLNLAQTLYLSGLISYPRTSSNQYPHNIDFKSIFSQLSKVKSYHKLCNEILKTKLIPNNGKKTDPAHPAIYTTGETPESLGNREERLFDLIVKRTLATFASKAVRETMNINMDVNGEIFVTKGTRTVEKGWHFFYEPYVLLKEDEFPAVKEKDELKVKSINLLSKETQPPRRYTQASIIKELENRNLGTKATRSSIVESLYNRNYVKEKSIEVTTLGLKTVETLEKYCPEILDEALTKHFEEEMEQIQQGSKKVEEVLDEAKKFLTKMLHHFKENEKKIGKELNEANEETRVQSSLVGKCTGCDGNLVIKYSKMNKSYFVACDNYPKCTVTFSIPKYAMPKPTGKLCEECNFPIVFMMRKGRQRSYEFCINPNCKLKESW